MGIFALDTRYESKDDEKDNEYLDCINNVCHCYRGYAGDGCELRMCPVSITIIITIR